MALLFVALVFLPQERLRVGNALRPTTPNVPGMRQSLIWAAILIGAAVVLAPMLSTQHITAGSAGFSFGVILLSLVLLTGYSGQASLCQFTFVGLGGYAMAHWGHNGSILGILAGMVLCAVVGAALAAFTLRLRGLYLALSTFAFAAAMDAAFFKMHLAGQEGGDLSVSRLHIPGIDTSSPRAFFVLLAVIFAAAGVGMLALRRGQIGRRLTALSDSPAACATLGVDLNVTKLAVFAAAAALAGLGGALYTGQQGSVSANDVVVLNSVIALLLVRVGGVSTVTGALLGAMSFAIFPLIQAQITSEFPGFTGNLSFLLTGAGAIALGRNPNGLSSQLAGAGAAIKGLVQRPPSRTAISTAAVTS